MPRRVGIILLVSALLAGALAGAAWFTAAHRQEVLTDDSQIELPTSRALPRDILWQPPTPADTAQIPADAIAVAASPGAERFAFAAPGPGGDLDLFESARTDGRTWSTQRLGLASSPDHDTTPAYSPDGRWLYFASDRPGGQGGYDLWRSPASEGGWGPPEHIDSALIQSAGDELSPALLPGGGALVLSRRASSAEPADLIFIALEGDAPKRIVTHTLNTESDERSPAFSPAGDFLYFASDRPGGAGGHDLYRARLTREYPGEPAWLGEEVNSEADETNPAIDTAGFRLLFRTATDDGAAYRETTAREVYRAVRSRWPSFGVGTQLLSLLPWILAALALVLLFAALRGLASREHWQRRWGTLGLMARCVLASMAIHAVLAVLLSLWQVETSLPGQSDRGEMQVALTTRSSMNDIAAQLHAPTLSQRGEPQEDSRPPSEQPAAARAEALAPAQASAPATAANTSDAASRQEAGAPAEPARSELRVEASSLPAASRSRSDETQSRESAVRAAAAAEVTPQAPGAQAEVLRPADAGNPAAMAAEIGEARTQVEFDGPADAAPDPTAQAAAVPDLPMGPRETHAEPTSRQAASNPGARAPPAADAARAESIALDAPSASDPAPTAPRLADAQTPLNTPAASNTPGPAVTLPQLNAPGLPTLTAEAPEPVTISHRPGLGQSPTPTLSSAPTKELRHDPAGAQAAPLAQRLADATSTAASLAAPVLSVATEMPAVALPEGDAAEAQADPSQDPAPASPLAEAQSAPLVPAPTRALRAESDAGSAPAVLDRLADAAAGLSLASPRLPLVAPGGQSPMLPMARVIAGIVLDDQTGQPVPEATVRLDGEADTIRTTHADTQGRFTLTPARLPDFAALTASAEGYIPTAINVAESEVGDGMWVELRLSPANLFDIALDDEPRVHHLGNDEFTGRINSQFQVKSEGTVYTATVQLQAAQLEDPIVGAEFRAFVRGAQNANPITVNGRRLATRMTDSPDDGSFGEFVARIPLRLLREGENVIEIRATDREGTDIDDFEFVNPRLVLRPREERRGNRL